MAIELNSTQTRLLTNVIAGLGSTEFAPRLLGFIRALSLIHISEPTRPY